MKLPKWCSILHTVLAPIEGHSPKKVILKNIIIGDYCPVVRVSGDDDPLNGCRYCNGLYTKSKNEEINGKPVYVDAYDRNQILWDEDHLTWHIQYKKTGNTYYEKTTLGGGPEGEYKSYDEDYATVKCER